MTKGNNCVPICCRLIFKLPQNYEYILNLQLQLSGLKNPNNTFRRDSELLPMVVTSGSRRTSASICSFKGHIREDKRLQSTYTLPVCSPIIFHDFILLKSPAL